MPAAKPATRRTTAPRTPTAGGAKVHDFEAQRKKIVKARKNSGIKKWSAYGRVWNVKRPNVAFVAEQEGQQSIASLIGTLAAYFVKDERPDFVKALAADEDLDFDVLGAMIADVSELVYAE